MKWDGSHCGPPCQRLHRAAMNSFIVAVGKGVLHAAAVKRQPLSVQPFAYAQETVNMMGQGPHPHTSNTLYYLQAFNALPGALYTRPYTPTQSPPYQALNTHLRSSSPIQSPSHPSQVLRAHPWPPKLFLGLLCLP